MWSLVVWPDVQVRLKTVFIGRGSAHLVVSLGHERLQLLGVHEVLRIVANVRLANEFKQLAKRVLCAQVRESPNCTTSPEEAHRREVADPRNGTMRLGEHRGQHQV
jgi:hypothetical protein